MKKILLGALLSCCSVGVFADVVVVVNPGNGNAVDADVVKRIYLGKTKSFSDGLAVSPVNQDGTSVADEFNSKVVGKSSSQLNAYWAKLVFTGKGAPPAKVNSDQAVIDFVAANNGAIGYVDSVSVSPKVKVVATF